MALCHCVLIVHYTNYVAHYLSDSEKMSRSRLVVPKSRSYFGDQRSRPVAVMRLGLGLKGFVCIPVDMSQEQKETAV